MHCACGCGQVTPVAKRNRRELGHVRGEHIPFVPGHRTGIAVGFDVESRGYVTPCHIWRGHDVRGYGRVMIRGREMLAHVAAWEAVAGAVPEGCELDHLCKQPACINVLHLEPVTHAENCRRGRATKLTADDARAIRGSAAAAHVIADVFGVSRSTVQAIRTGRRWADV